MRAMICLVATVATIGLSLPAWGQAYDPHYPVCIQTYGPFGGISCKYSSMAACRLSAQGGAAQCLANPYFGQKRKSRH